MTAELLSPAGSLRNMRYALAFGADAVYAGQPRYSLRVRNNEFRDLEVLAEGINECHRQGKQFYLASNISPHNDKIRSYLRDLEPVIELQPDALIMADPGLIMLVKERWPDMPIHLSVQANAVNWATVKFWYQNGVSRVILSRELSLEEIGEIRERVPEMELEVFVHGALCIAYSGRCLLSGYMNHRDSNQGACTNACRWQYQAHDAKEDDSGDLIPAQQIATSTAEAIPVQQFQPEPVLLQQRERPGEFMPAYEDEHGTYIMNSKDLRAVQHVAKLMEMGIHSLKIEGRTKSHYYAARTAQVYRRAISDAAAGRPFDMGLMDQLETLANRGYTEGFYRRHPPKEYQSYELGQNTSQQQQFVGEVVDWDGQIATVDVKNRFALGDTLELMTPAGNHRFALESLLDKREKNIDVAPGSGHRVKIPLPVSASDDAMTFGLLVKNIHSGAA
ncbi:tRNA 5-hydroxyuridine modification protein YegQ [Spongiibacter taiwanensis]|uniref:prephenate-dependent tRNA uridine(34) hydroxylase TrhP n=1 Tax=Spongiibacter taiwanensis TaxID=1748242 RepID=UPI0020361ACA|nr:tRNA 5-hydroxyuridine modification protein YegQ [Spongiibacter taiwanensis]USA41895.1 tRNA 5-hydroxyuridine modification protein YegQ [Spongiibacter taiwanensis]